MVACLFLLSIFFVHHAVGLNDHCSTSSCGMQGPPVRFPFRIKGRQPLHCSYPAAGFDLSCSENNHTVLELPNSWKLLVQAIDYEFQVIYASYLDGFFPPRRLLLNSNLSGISPFFFMDELYYSYNIFNCSSKKEHYSLKPVSCLSDLRYHVYAIYSHASFQDLVPLLSCSKLHNISIVAESNLCSPESVLRLKWYYPECSYCEAKGKYCRLKSNTIGSETECYGIIKPTKGSAIKFMATGTVLGSIFLAVAAILFYRRHRFNRIEREYQSKIEKFLDDYKSFKPARYSYAVIKRMTNQFKDELGQGAYGTVFRGKLSDEILVAVKVLNNSKGNGEEFVNEVEAIGKIHHVNVIRLIGFCADGFIRALVYEYLPNSLQKFVSSADSKSHFLGWKRLQDIALGIAKGIEYLHQGCERRILHFDIKPHNILLDHNFSPKISDFGMAKFCSKDQSAVSMKTARGTAGYMAPELFSRNFRNVSYKSDVYSFGVLVLEMVGGRKITHVTEGNDEEIYFPEWIYNLLEKGEDLRFEIEEEGDDKIAKKLAIVGLQCIQWNPADRPSMNVVVHMLEGEENLPIPPNPFSAVPTRMNSRIPGRRPQQELDVISERE
ncbi:rust resistance kinase Lr10 [Hevea brasiliensis]|uniref:rust resistance kinase Lr10 n=1 Tax=Hevea brasiliensis TaxID=3981 RepID=UPI0025D41776|nr:rust resistance kinase Lr10 [Hevea brasiliensis]